MRYSIVYAVAIATTFAGVLSAPVADAAADAIALPVEDAALMDRAASVTIPLRVVAGLDTSVTIPLGSIKKTISTIKSTASASQLSAATRKIQQQVNKATNQVNNAVSMLEASAGGVGGILGGATGGAVSGAGTILADTMDILTTLNSDAVGLTNTLGSENAEAILAPLTQSVNSLIGTLSGMIPGFSSMLEGLVANSIGELSTALGGISFSATL